MCRWKIVLFNGIVNVFAVERWSQCIGTLAFTRDPLNELNSNRSCFQICISINSLSPNASQHILCQCVDSDFKDLHSKNHIILILSLVMKIFCSTLWVRTRLCSNEKKSFRFWILVWILLIFLVSIALYPVKIPILKIFSFCYQKN